MKNKLVLLICMQLYSLSDFAQSVPNDFKNLKEAIPNVVIDLRYFSSDNFIGDTITGYYSSNCYLTIQATEALNLVQKELNKQNLGLKIFDGYRPQRAVDHFVKWAKDLDDIKMKNIHYPEVEKSRLFELGYIAAKSGHTRGSTLDLTIIYLSGPDKGKEMDMGTPWDFFSEKSWPESDQVTSQQKENRMLLQKVMIKYGFKHYQAEWWHFTLANEPFPDTYFDFPIE